MERVLQGGGDGVGRREPPSPKVRHHMYLEDESVYVGEPRQPNSGIPQGTFLKRHKIPKDDKGGTFGVGDIEVGSTVTFYGRTFFVTSCDAFTREYLTSMGKPPAEEVPMPDEPIDAYRATLKKDTQLNPYPQRRATMPRRVHRGGGWGALQRACRG